MDTNILDQFGNFLQKIRIKKRLSQENLAEISGLDRTYISLLERGKRNPSLSCINAIFQSLNIDIAMLFQSSDWVEELVKFSQCYDLEIEYITEILNDPKVIPMIRGKSFEFTVKKYIVELLPKTYEITNPRLNAQTGMQDVDVLIINQQTNQKYTLECKLASKGSFHPNTKGNPWLAVKCMRSRTLGDEAAQQRANTTGLAYELWKTHTDQYRQEDFDFVVTSMANTFYQTNEHNLYVWNPDEQAQLFLNKLGINNQQQAFNKMFIARSKDLIATENNQIKYQTKCTRKKCSNSNCGFIPNYPKIFFDMNTGNPLPPWFPLDQLESLLS